MKYRIQWSLLLQGFIFLALLSCGGTPTPPATEEPTPPPSGQAEVTGPSKEDLDALNSARERAENARKKALDVQGPVYFPDEWKGAESKYTDGNNAKKDTADGVKGAIASYTAAADGYDAIAGKSGPLYAQDQENALKALQDAIARAERSRKDAEDTKGPVYFPDDWKNAEAKHQAGKDAPKDTIEEKKSAVPLYTEAADKYDDIAAKRRTQMAKEKDDAMGALNAAIARMEKSRKGAQDNQGPVYFPNDWKNAEAQNKAATDAKKTDADEVKKATALYSQAADSYDAIAAKSLAQGAKEKSDALAALNAAIARMEKSRKDAQDNQGPTYFPKDWQAAEAKNKAGQDAKKDSGAEIKAAAALYTQAADAYDAIAAKSRAQVAKEKDDALQALQAAMARAQQSRKNAQDVGAPAYFPSDWQNGEAKNTAGTQAKKNTPEEIKAAAALYTQAADIYDDITNRSQPLFAKDQEDANKALQAAMARMEQSRKNAQDVQAPVYFPKEWQTAESQNKAGQDAKKTTPDEIKAATALYTQAADSYDDLAGRSRATIAQQDQGDTLKALQDAIARAEQSRKQSYGFQGPTYFPKDWQTAEAQKQKAENAKQDTPEAMKEATALYTGVADAYDDITRRSRPQYIKNWEDGLKRERTAAVDAGINTIAPNHLSTADQAAAKTRRDLTGDDYIPDGDTVSLPADMYRALKSRADGSRARQEIVEQDFTNVDPDALAAGDADTATAIQNYEAGDPKSARDKAEDALDQYNAVLRSGWLALARQRMLAASQERQSAENVKAPVAVPNDFNGADTVYRQALEDFNAEQYESAANLYYQAALQFIAAAKAAEDKRRLAEETITKAKQKTAESTALATSAGLIMEEE